MDTKALEKFCPWARNVLIEAVDLRCRRYALDPDALAAAPAGSDVVAGRVLSEREKTQRAKLAERIEARGYEAFCDQMAYTWFNRFAAIRYMELHDYLPSHVRMLSAAEDGSFNPDCLRQAADLGLAGLDATEALRLMAASDDGELFRRIIVAQCNELAECLPEVFGQVDDADALTLPDDLLRAGEHDFLYHLVADIPEAAWENVEVLGWMYQFYNSEIRDEFFKSKSREAAAGIGPVTQLYTPEWVVRYMAENSLGKLWMLNHPGSDLRERMAYYIESDDECGDFIRIDSPEDITFCDPACGSGHILSYAFELLFAMYEESGYVARDIPGLILTKNLSGMEIDKRAAQIASLVLALCARKYDRRFFGRGIRADIYVFESIVLTGGETSLPQRLTDEFAHLGEIGSLLNPSDKDMALLRTELNTCVFSSAGEQIKLERAIEACKVLRRHFDVVVTNPPHMGSSSCGSFMSKWVKKSYPVTKRSLWSCFIERILGVCKLWGFSGFFTSNSWMFLSSFEALRNRLIDDATIETLVQLPEGGFHGITAPTCTFVLRNSTVPGYKGAYICLDDFHHHSLMEPKTLEAINDPTCGWLYRVDASTFHSIPGAPIAYRLGMESYRAFEKGQALSAIANIDAGAATGNNDFFLRLWYEAPSTSVGKDYKFYSKGGLFRRWYGNREHIVRCQNDEEKTETQYSSLGGGSSRSFEGCLSWSAITSLNISFRILDAADTVIGNMGPACRPSPDLCLYLLGLLNSSPICYFAKSINPTLHWNPSDVGAYPILLCDAVLNIVNSIVDQQIHISKTDYDSFETSWDFKRSPLL